MTVIKVVILLSLTFLLSCTTDDTDLQLGNTGYVRFFLLTNAENEVLEYPSVDTNGEPVSNYEKDNIEVLKIPVALTYPAIEGDITATFSSEIHGDLNLTIEPEGTLKFTPTHLVDTIYVTVNGQWDATTAQQLDLVLVATDNPNVNIGAPNSASPNNTLTVDFQALSFQYSFNTNKITIEGEIGEEIYFNLDLPKGYFPGDIDDNDIFSFTNGFEYTLARESENTNRIDYKLTLEEDIQNDSLSFISTINLLENNGYVPRGNTVLLIEKPVKIERDLSTNPAANFYNLSDTFFRTYGENWGDFSNTGECKWGSFFAFSFPVVVEADDRNAVLYDDKGTSDPSDDIYHHAFKIGFDSRVIEGSTTNSFNLKRWFNNESTRENNSPGFNVDPALEFFPGDNGNSTTSGNVLVESQPITISSVSGNSYTIDISGQGTYREISPGLFEVSLTFNATNDELFGGTITSEYRLYNNAVYPAPQPLTHNNCITPINL